MMKKLICIGVPVIAADQAIKAEQQQQWQESEKDGPPPWAAASRKEMPDN